MSSSETPPSPSQPPVSAFKAKWAYIQELARALRSPDPGTRRMAWFLWLSILGAVIVLCISIVHLKRALGPDRIGHLTPAEAEKIRLEMEKHKGAEESKTAVYNLGAFGVALKDVPKSKPLRGVVNMAELVIVVECDSKATCDHVETYQVQARDIVTAVLEPQDREDLMSLDGKERLKSTIADRLNAWLEHGQIRKVFFSSFVID